MSELLDWAKFLSPIAIMAVAWYAKVDKAVKKAEAAPTKEQVKEAIHEVQDKVLGEIAPMKEDLAKQSVHIEWIVNTLKERK
jgi:hypothetical protein